MQSKAIFSFAIIAIFAIIQLELQTINSTTNQKLQETINKSIQAEKLNLYQTLIEQNTDKIIQKNLEKALALQQSSNQIIKLKTNTELINFYEQLQNTYKNPKINFYFTKLNSNKYEKLLNTKEKQKLSLKKINELSKVNLLNTGGKSIAAEYIITGGEKQNITIFAIIESKQTKQLFVLPRNYTIRRTINGTIKP